jgi:hypothetical protein
MIIYFEYNDVVCSNVTIIGLAMVLDTCLENVFALGILCCLISNVLMNLLQITFYFKTNQLVVIQLCLGCDQF